MLCSGEDSVKWVRVAVEPRCGPGERSLCQVGAWFWSQASCDHKGPESETTTA
jgi:hypothetical protein